MPPRVRSSLSFSLVRMSCFFMVTTAIGHVLLAFVRSLHLDDAGCAASVVAIGPGGRPPWCPGVTASRRLEEPDRDWPPTFSSVSRRRAREVTRLSPGALAV